MSRGTPSDGAPPLGHGVPAHTPASSAGDLEPYGARMRLRPGPRGLDAAWFLKALLEDVASYCVREGASVIGHLKCFLRAGDGHLRCNLTSVRGGATCRGEGAEVIAPGGDAELDLAVLVYGVPAGTVDRLVGEALKRLLSPLGVCWTKEPALRGNPEAQ